MPRYCECGKQIKADNLTGKCRPCRGESDIAYEPSQDEIRSVCEEIRSGWNPNDVRLKEPDPWQPPQVHANATPIMTTRHIHKHDSMEW